MCCLIVSVDIVCLLVLFGRWFFGYWGWFGVLMLFLCCVDWLFMLCCLACCLLLFFGCCCFLAVGVVHVMWLFVLWFVGLVVDVV